MNNISQSLVWSLALDRDRSARPVKPDNIREKQRLLTSERVSKILELLTPESRIYGSLKWRPARSVSLGPHTQPPCGLRAARGAPRRVDVRELLASTLISRPARAATVAASTAKRGSQCDQPIDKQSGRGRHNTEDLQLTHFRRTSILHQQRY
jgi:hypothetical protein